MANFYIIITTFTYFHKLYNLQPHQIGRTKSKEATLTSLENKLTNDSALLQAELTKIREILDTFARDIAELRQLQISSMHVPHPLDRTSSTLC